MTNNLADDTDILLAILTDSGLTTEDVGITGDGGSITNVMRDGEYIATVTITRTPGY